MVKGIIYKEATSQDLILSGKDFFDRDLYLEKTADIKFKQMQSAAKYDGVSMYVVSGFRSYKYQQAIIDRKLANGLTIEEISQVNALVGESEHHTGRAIDITSGSEVEVLTEEFENTTTYKWLCENAYKYGFVMSFPRNNEFGFIYEPWHWCFNYE